MNSRVVAVLLPLVLVGVLLLGAGTARAQCRLELETGTTVLGTDGTGVRLAMDPVEGTPVAMWQDATRGAIVYRRFYGPGWGPIVTVDTGGELLPMVPSGENAGLYIQGLDFVLDSYGRPRLVLANETGVYHTRYGAGWAPLDTLMAVTLGELPMGGLSVRLEQDPVDPQRVHLLYWTEAWTGGGPNLRSWHGFDDGSGAGFGALAEFHTGGWKPRGAVDHAGDLHVVSFSLFPDPASTHGQYQALYWLWSQASGWPTDPLQLTTEPNPPVKINNAGPVGFQPDVAIAPDGAPHVVFPAHYDDAVNGDVRYIHRTSGSWSTPTQILMPANGHAGRPLLAIDHHATKLSLCLVYGKRWAVDLGDGAGWGADDLWHGDGGHWLFHDLIVLRGQFWLAYVAAARQQQGVGNVEVKRFLKADVATCPGIDPGDLDDDGVPDVDDLCPGVPDPAQGDADGDGTGDLCDEDDDGDGIPDETDVCPRVADPAQTDSDGDGLGDACANQVDNDGDGTLAPWDCDDDNPQAFPGNPEVCDGVDNDCDGLTDFAGCDIVSDGDTISPDGTASPTDAGGNGGGDGVNTGCSCRQAGTKPTLRSQPRPLPLLLLLGLIAWRIRGRNR